MLEIRNLHTGYGESVVIRDLSLTVPQGSLATILGSNGVGKSTLLKTIMGILPVQSGTIQWKGRSMETLSGWIRSRAGIGYVPQGRDIFPFLSVHENLVLGLEASGIKAKQIRKEADILYQMFSLLAPIRKRRGGDLSGGQQQILALARVLIQKPEILILDEPSEGIQPSIVEQISDALGMIKREGVSILLVEQYPDFALTHADWYGLMAHGDLMEEGPVDSSNRNQIRGKIHI